MPKLYIDTNIIIDAVEDRSNKFGKNIGEYSMSLFLEAVSCKYDLIISSFMKYELNKKLKGNFSMFFDYIRAKTISIDHTYKDEFKARELSQDNFDDALHVILAEKAKADYIITRNIKDFKKIKTSIPIRRPEDILNNP